METSTQRSKGRGMIGKKRSHAKQGAARMLGFSAGVGMTHCDIRRLARRGGVKRISAGVYDDVRDALRTKLSRWIQRIATVVEHSQRHTVTPFDVVYALKHDGITLYGFGEREGPLHATTKKQRRPLGESNAWGSRKTAVMKKS